MQSYGSPFSSKSNLAPRVPTSASSSRRSSLLPGMKNVSSRYSISGQSNQSVHVVCKTPYHIVENFGLSLPVLVTEALTFTDRNTVVSVSISSEGWAWFVCGRRLLIWQYKQSLDSIRQRQHVNSQCQELTLPPSDLAHKSDLVCIFIPSGHQVPACIAASPEGMIRYWPSILHPGASVEQSADLQGQECYSLNNIAPSGCILSTTTSSIVLVEPLIQGGRHTLSCRPLRPPHGWLGGIGRRVSSLIFGSLPTAQLTEMKLIKVVTVHGEEVNSKDSWKVYVLAEHSLQKWIVSSGQQDILIFESDISCLIRESFCTSIWETCAGSPNELDVWMLDMQATDGGLMVLCAAVNSSISPQMHYALGKLMTESNSAPQKFSSFVPLKYTSIYRDGGDIEAVEYHFLLSSHGAYIYNQKVVLAALAPNYGDEPDVIEFMSPGDRLLGGAMCGNVPVFFSKIHGLVSLSSSDLAPNDFLNSSISLSDFPAPTEATMSKVSEGVNITMSDLELEELTISDDTYSRLKAAFIYYLKNRNKVQSMTIVQEIFPEESEPLNEIDDVIDTLVIKMSRDLLNDIPAGDPRWAEAKSNAISMGCLNSFQILHQLQDKQKALELLVQFLKDVKLWNRFSAVRIRNVAMATSHIIGEFAEKILAAIALRSLPQEHSTIVEANIKIVLAENSKMVTGGLNHFDLFYREVSEIHKIFQVMTKSCEDIMQSDRRPHEVATMVAGVNSVILSVLQEVIQYRQQNAEMFSPSTPLSPTICEYVPWTSSPGKGGLRDSLTSQQELTLKCGSSVTGEIMLKNQLFDQLVHLIDIILDGHKCHLESIRGVDKFEALLLEYERERTTLIQQFLKIEEYERAAILAEKYCDFQILIQICEQTDNKDRLDEYLKKFEQQNFSEYLFNWYIQENKQGRLLEHFRNHKIQHTQQAALSRFLEQHPKLSWILNVYNEDYLKASSTLLSLAKDEKEFLARKKAMLSLGKLAQLASNSASERQDDLVDIESELQLVEHQEDLPEIVLSSLGYDFKKQKVLGPAEIITLYISEENHSVTEYDFKKCLDLLNYIDDEFEKSELRHSIWCRVILQDKWVNEGTISPASIVEKTIFYRLADIICFLGGANDDFLPPIDRLLEAHELGNLKDNSSFQYLLKVAYEHIERTLLTV